MGFNKLIKNKYRNLLFTTPSHSQKFCIVNKFRHFYKYDVSETDTHCPEEMLEEAQQYAASIYNTKATYFLTNGSSSGIIASVLSCVKKNERVLLWSNSHRCHKNAVILSGAIPVYYDLPIDDEIGVTKGVSPEIIENYLKNNSDIKAVIISSPTYEGFV